MLRARMCEHSNGSRPEDGVPDLSMMSDITDHGININLKTRYKRDQIYTFSGSILIAVNPYKQLDIYDLDWITRYRERKLDQTDPHIFALTEAMYINLVMQNVSMSQTRQGADVDNDNIQVDASNSQAQATISKTQNLITQNSLSCINQACVISGESGAGKTETTKFILSYLCSITPNKSTWMEHQILEANTILEAFGNSKTVRNDNSSRFGKFIQICFDSRHQINGCIIQDYLLEQSRITYQSIGERNYHVFYQLLAAGQASQELRTKFHLMPENFYNYLNKTTCYQIESVDDCAMFDSLRTAMSVLNMDKDSCDGTFSILSAILWLGNLQFQSDEAKQNSEQCCLTPNDDEIVNIISQLLGIDKDILVPIMLRRQINVRGTITEIPFKVHEAQDNRHAMAKVLYSKLFAWLVSFINASTNPSQDKTSFLGILDIFGFENFESNSFEQLCINYANEKLHKFFNHHMFAMEQELYRSEGIQFCDINYTDNTFCLELLEKPPSCILRLLSEECRMPKGNDLTFIEKLHNEFSISNPSPYYSKGIDRRNWSTKFEVKHFAGSVTYKVSGFLNKNRDTQQSQLLDIIETSSCELLRKLVNPRTNNTNQEASKSDRCMKDFRRESIDSATARSNFNHKPRLSGDDLRFQPNHNTLRRESSFGGSMTKNNILSNVGSTKSNHTVVDAFRQQLSSLVDLLNSTHPWYVRCIKPNLDKLATEYDDKQVLQQLRYLGMSDLIKIRREGYPIHLTKHQFVCRYRCLMLTYLRLNPTVSPIKLDERSLDNYCSRMMNYFHFESNDWKIGKTMVFLRSNIYQPLETERSELFVKMAIIVQSQWRSFVCKRKFKHFRSAAIRIQEKFRAHRGRLQYLRKKRAILTIQAYCRGMFAREIANALREIKRAEVEKAKKQAQLAMARQLQFDLINQQQNSIKNELEKKLTLGENGSVIDDPPRRCNSNEPDNRNLLASNTGTSSPMSQLTNTSPAVSTSASWVGQDFNSSDNNMDSANNNHNRDVNARDRKEMDELVKVLERHGISLDALEQNNDSIYSDFEKLYDVLGNQLQVNFDARSLSSMANAEDDQCSLATVGTENCDGDSVSCSGQSQVSSTVAEDINNNRPNPNEVKLEANGTTNSSNQHDSEIDSQDETVNQNNDAQICDASGENKYESNSVESIPSIVSSTSTNSNQPGVNESLQMSQAQAENAIKQVFESQTRMSTFTENTMTVSGSKHITNARPLTRIEEEPNSTATSPSKTPHKSRPQSVIASRPQSLFPPLDEDTPPDVKLTPQIENRKRRIEKKILQMQQEQQTNYGLINPTTAGVIANTIPKLQEATAETNGTNMTNHKNVEQPNLQPQMNLISTLSSEDSIYAIDKCNIIEYLENLFNNHIRDPSFSGTGVIKTLTRRRKSVDTNLGEYLTKAEMLSYNSSHSIPTSHFKMHDPQNVQISCSMFKNLNKFMTSDSITTDNEIRIIQSITKHGIEKTELRDEIYVQIIRQLTNNPNHEQCLKLWILLGLVSVAFLPSKGFSKHLIALIRNKPRKDPSITCHAQFCLDNLQASRIDNRRYPPSPVEIQACANLAKLNCKIHLLDGRCESIGFHPCDTVNEILIKLSNRIGLQSIEGWSLYESYMPGLSKYPHPQFEQLGDFEKSLKSHQYIADVLAIWQSDITKKQGANNILKTAQKRVSDGNFKFTLKKKTFRGPNIRNDPVEIGLLYSQAVYNVVKKDNFLVDENLALSFSGLQAQVNLGNASDLYWKDKDQTNKKSNSKATTHPKQVYEIEKYVCQRLRHQGNKTKKEWLALISQSHKQLHGANDVLCRMRYLSLAIHHCPLYGTTLFRASYKGYQELDQNLLLGVNSQGLLLIRVSDKHPVGAYRYTDICFERGICVYLDENIIQLNVRDRADELSKCLTFESVESEEIALLMVSYFPKMKVAFRGNTNHIDESMLRPNFDQFKRNNNNNNSNNNNRHRLKMTLEDRMRIHQEVQNARKAIVRSGKLRRPTQDENSNSTSLFRHTLKRLSSSSNITSTKTRFDNIYGTSKQIAKGDIPQTSSDYNLYGQTVGNNSIYGPISKTETDLNQAPADVAGATASLSSDETTKLYPHRYWAYTKAPFRSSLLIIHDPDLEEAALANFNAILAYSGLINFNASKFGVNSNNGAQLSNFANLDSSSTDSGIASQQSLGTTGLNGKQPSSGSPSSNSSNDIYDICPKVDQRDLLQLAQNILDRCLKKGADILKNEFFLQLIKQTTDHPDSNSEINKRHWQLLALACSVTYPSDSKILAYLHAHLRRCSLDQVTDEGQYAQFTLKSLQGTLDTKGRRFAPSEIEILSTIECRRVYARVYFLDGQFQAVEFDPCATISEVIEQIKQKIGLKQDCMGYALFQPLDDDCEQVVHGDEKVGDAIAEWESWHKLKHLKSQQDESASRKNQNQSQNSGGSKLLSNKSSLASLNNHPKNKTHRFIFKKYLFFENLINLNDPVERELLYYQTISMIREDRFPLSEQEAPILCALKAQIEIGDSTKLTNLPREQVRMVYKEVIMSLMPPHMFNNLPIPTISQQHQAFRDLDCVEAKKYFFNLVQSFGRANYPNSSGYLMLHWAKVYDATQTFSTAWPSDIWIVINQAGFHIAVAKSRKILASTEYRQIVDYQSNNNYLMVVVMLNAQRRTKFTFYTKHAQQIAQQMRDYNVIASSSGNKRKKSVEFNIKENPKGTIERKDIQTTQTAEW